MQPVPTQLLGQRFAESYAGYEDESVLLRRIWDLAIRDGVRIHDEYPIYVNEAASLCAYIDTGVEARRMPWQLGKLGDEYYKQQEEIEEPEEFKRIHFNLWQNPQQGFVEIEKWECAGQVSRVAHTTSESAGAGGGGGGCGGEQ